METDKDRCKLLKKKKKKSKNNLTPLSTIAGDSTVSEDAANSCGNIIEIKIKLKTKSDLDNNTNQSHETEHHSTPKLKKNKKKRKVEPEYCHKVDGSTKKKKKVESKHDDDQSHETADHHSSPKLKKKKKKRKVETESCDEVERPIKKKKQMEPKNDDEYKPGMLSDLMQIKKYGRVIIPWDPSFGLDKKYNKKLKSRNEEDGSTTAKIKISPLFDLSKREPESSSDEATFFIGNLPSDTRIMDLKKLFSKYGIIYKAKIKQKKFNCTNKSNENGTDSEGVNATIKFKTLKSSEAVLKMNGRLYKNHHLRVTLLSDKQNVNRGRSVFVGNLAFNAQDDVLWKAFEKCGEIESVRIIRDDRSGKGRGFGYVNFKSADSVEAALRLDGQLVMDRELRVMKSNSKAFSVSNLITVKRKKIHKKRKSLRKDETSINTVKKLKKLKKASHESHAETQCEPLTSREPGLNMEKKVKKKKKKASLIK